ncbi:hypothetical protein [Amycolatopsis marina]|uniref:hypothetical protein n=1 Tax=Amycolatopsis marina TaxID=490629 RepID=UPI0011600E36|nr:hypothetical protein [Amycolatopsis marina]
MSVLLALALAGCSGGAPPPEPRPTPTGPPRDPGQLDVLPDFQPVVTVELVRELLGDQARYATEPKTSARTLTWSFESGVPLGPTLLVTAEIVTSFNGSSIGLAKKFFENGMIDREKFTEIDIPGADDAAMAREFEDLDDGVAINHIRITTRTRNGLADVWYRNGRVSQEKLTAQAKELAAGLVARYG